MDIWKEVNRLDKEARAAFDEEYGCRIGRLKAERGEHDPAANMGLVSDEERKVMAAEILHGEIMKKSRVRYIGDIESYREQSGNGAGTIVRTDVYMDHNGNWVCVMWDNGEDFNYPMSHLEIIGEPTMKPDMDLDEIHAAQELVNGKL